VPTEPCWPTEAEWSSFNTSIGGNLIASTPPAIACYPGPAYNEAVCNQTLASWLDSNLHAENPISIDFPTWANSSCNPIFANGTSVTGDPNAGEKGCTLGYYPVYAVNATSAEVISTAVRFVAEKNIRLVVKNTGHSFAGRSTGYGSLSIWTHHLKSFEFHEAWKPTECPSNSTENQMAATFGAGIQDRDAYRLTHEHGAVVSAGSNPSVGLAGWFTSGGHGPLSTTYGMGADNLLEARVILPNGDIVTTNECQYSDLFWALRGGGAGTFGIIVEATVKAFPSPQTAIVALNIISSGNTTNLTSRWWQLVARVHTNFPAIKGAGGQGYYTMAGPPIAPMHSFTGFFYHYNTSNATLEKAWKPVRDLLDEHDDLASYSFENFTTPTFFELWNASTAQALEPVASPVLLTSRLLSNRALTQDVSLVAQVFEKASPVLLGHMIANEKNRGLDIALNPAWRDTLVHMVAPTAWSDGDPPGTREFRLGWLRTIQARALKQLDPDSGAYVNEVCSLLL
jgi:hypothetical protein